MLKIAKQPFYRWLAAAVSDRDWSDAQLTNAAVDIHLDDPVFGIYPGLGEAFDQGVHVLDLGEAIRRWEAGDDGIPNLDRAFRCLNRVLRHIFCTGEKKASRPGTRRHTLANRARCDGDRRFDPPADRGYRVGREVACGICSGVNGFWCSPLRAVILPGPYPSSEVSVVPTSKVWLNPGDLLSNVNGLNAEYKANVASNLDTHSLLMQLDCHAVGLVWREGRDAFGRSGEIKKDFALDPGFPTWGYSVILWRTKESSLAILVPVET